MAFFILFQGRIEMNDEWKPRTEDVEWTRMTVSLLKIGGTWGTTFGIYTRTGEKELTLTMDESLFLPDVEELRKRNQDRVKKCIEAMGWKYIDQK